MSIDVNLFSFALQSSSSGCDDLAQSVCGGRRFRRVFSKRDFPILGEDEDEQRRKEHICLSARSRDLIPKNLSVSVRQARDRLRDPETGKWRWPTNGADLVSPGVYLGDA